MNHSEFAKAASDIIATVSVSGKPENLQAVLNLHAWLQAIQTGQLVVSEAPAK